jgi:CBS domain-containing protein
MATIERHMARDLVTLEAGGSCHHAAELMREHRIGAVAVVEGGEIVGLVAERDLALRVVGEGTSPEVPVGEIVQRNGPSVGPRATEKECADLMRQHHCRHLLVKEEGRVTGLISMRDVMVVMLDEKEGVIRQLEGYISGH